LRDREIREREREEYEREREGGREHPAGYRAFPLPMVWLAAFRFARTLRVYMPCHNMCIRTLHKHCHINHLLTY
jgi:hypothetical protein